MTAAQSAGARLERRYRLLLLAYPGRYRRRHGTEMVTTLLEMAGPGQDRPGRADVADLIRGGLRQRFRLPAGRPPVVLAAVLVAVLCAAIGGALGAAAGSWAGTLTFAGLPDEAGLTAIAERVSGPGATEYARGRDGGPLRGDALTAGSRMSGAWDAEQAAHRLAADGWRVGPVTSGHGTLTAVDADSGRPRTVEVHGAQFHAERDGVQVYAYGSWAGGHADAGVSVWPRMTPAFKPLVAAGGLLGLIAGWLIAAALTDRIAKSPAAPRHAPAGRHWAAAGLHRAAGLLTGVAVLLLAMPTSALYLALPRTFAQSGDGPVSTVHSALDIGIYLPFRPPAPEGLILALTAGGLLVGAVAAILATPDRPAGRAEHTTA